MLLRFISLASRDNFPPQTARAELWGGPREQPALYGGTMLFE